MNTKSKRELPQSKIKAALLAEEVGLNWADKFPNFVVSRLSPQSLQADAAQLKQLCQDSHNNDCARRQNTVDLLALNTLINKGLNTLKSHIKISCWENNQHNTEYAKYGLEVRKRSYQLPVDNGLRQFALQFLVNKLQEANNPIANQAQGLQFWLDLQTHHTQLWQNSQQLRARRSLLAQKTDELANKILSVLQHIRKALSIEYSGSELLRQKRVMGFLKESL